MTICSFCMGRIVDISDEDIDRVLDDFSSMLYLSQICKHGVSSLIPSLLYCPGS